MICDAVFILDGSSSMCGKEKKILEEYNQLVEDCKKEKKENLYITTAIFRENCELLQFHMPIKYVRKLNEFQYYTYGNTAYYDSVIEVVELMEGLVKERRSSVFSEILLFIIGDKLDTMSVKHTKGDLDMILSQKKKEGWTIAESGKNVRE